jgi:RNA polymerase sigma-70 factor (ECF subfamily)
MPKNSQNFIGHYNQFKDKIYNYILYRTGFDRDLAEDLTSEVFIKAFKSFESFDKELNFQAWIFTIARNHLINHYRASKKTVPLEDMENVLQTKSDELGQKLEVERILDIINRMDDSDKDPLLLRYSDGLSNTEIASVLEKDEGAVRTQISRSLVKLRKILNNE